MTMDRGTKAEQERPCPCCSRYDHALFADERIDETRLDGYAYASRKTPEFMRLRLVRCLHCDLVYAPSPPSPESLQKAYSAAAYDSAPEALAAARTYADALRHFVSSQKNKKAAIDVGAGSGPLLPMLEQMGFSPVVGIEPSRAAIEAAAPDVRPMLREGMFTPALVADLQASLVCSFMTLEHLRDPAAFVGIAAQLLEPGGLLAVVVHDRRAWINRLLGMRSPIMDLEHLQLFSPASLRALLLGAGFRSVTLRSIRNTYPLRYWLRLTPLPESLKKALATLFTHLRLIDRPVSFSVGNLLAVGIKSAEAPT